MFKSHLKDREFVWLAEYADGLSLLESDKVNCFYDIEKQKLIRYGLIGHGYHFYFNTVGGTFNLRNSDYKFILEDEFANKYEINNSNIIYNDIIQYKSACTDFNMMNKNAPLKSFIYMHSLGYKKQVSLTNTKFSAKNLLHVPLDKKPIYFEIMLVCYDRDINGKVYIIKNDQAVDSVEVKINKGRAGKFEWVVR